MMQNLECQIEIENALYGNKSQSMCFISMSLIAVYIHRKIVTIRSTWWNTQITFSNDALSTEIYWLLSIAISRFCPADAFRESEKLWQPIPSWQFTKRFWTWKSLLSFKKAFVWCVQTRSNFLEWHMLQTISLSSVRLQSSFACGVDLQHRLICMHQNALRL